MFFNEVLRSGSVPAPLAVIGQNRDTSNHDSGFLDVAVRTQDLVPEKSWHESPSQVVVIGSGSSQYKIEDVIRTSYPQPRSSAYINAC